MEYAMTLDLEWLRWYIARCGAGVQLDPETHRLAAEKIAYAIERKAATRRKRSATFRRKRQD